MEKVLVLDLSKCSGCRSCEMACSTAREGAASPSLSRIKVTRFDSEDFYCPVVCQQCEKPYCALVCPTGALYRNSETGIVELNEDKCVACKMCLLACPFGALSIKEGTKIMKCDLCGGEPVCVKFCPNKTITYSADYEIGESRRMASAESLKIAYVSKEEPKC